MQVPAHARDFSPAGFRESSPEKQKKAAYRLRPPRNSCKPDSSGRAGHRPSQREKPSRGRAPGNCLVSLKFGDRNEWLVFLLAMCCAPSLRLDSLRDTAPEGERSAARVLPTRKRTPKQTRPAPAQTRLGSRGKWLLRPRLEEKHARKAMPAL